MLGEGVQVGVGGRVVGLARAADEPGDRGEQDERVQVQVRGQFVQQQRRLGLGPADLGEGRVGQRLQGAVGGDACRVHHRAQRVLRRDGGEQCGEGGAVGDVAGDEGDLGAERGEPFHQGRGAGGVRAAPAGQQQATDSVPGDQVFGDEAAQRSGGSREQDRPGPDGRLPAARRARRQPGHGRHALPQGELGLAGRQGGCQGRLGGRGAVRVDEHEAPWVLRLRGADQAPQRGLGEPGHPLALRHGGGLAGHHDQAPVGIPGGGPGAQVGQQPDGSQVVVRDQHTVGGAVLGYRRGGRRVVRLQVHGRS